MAAKPGVKAILATYTRLFYLLRNIWNVSMIIISGGMPRSGSRWYRRVTQGLLQEAGYPGIKELREKYGPQLDPQLHPGLKLHRLIKFDRLARAGETFTVKTHTPPTIAMQWYLATDRFTGTYTYRDPRDVVVSALELGRKMREEGLGQRFLGIGPYRSFARLHTVEGAITWLRWMQIPNCMRWIRNPNVLVTKYEDIRADTFGQIKRLSEFIGLELGDEQISDVIARFDSGSTPRSGKIINKGIIGRYREVFSPEEQALLNKKLGKYIVELGYSL